MRRLALAGFGVAMAVNISMQESVRDFKKFVQSRTNQEETPDAPKRTYAVRILGVVAVMAVLRLDGNSHQSFREYRLGQ